MTEWVPGPMFFYADPDGDYIDDEGNWIEVEGHKGGMIASVQYPYDGKNQPAAVLLIGTNDRAQAERWRSVFAAGGYPDLRTDPPIIRPPRRYEVPPPGSRNLGPARDLLG